MSKSQPFIIYLLSSQSEYFDYSRTVTLLLNFTIHKLIGHSYGDYRLQEYL